jgi:hypothetical protein
MKTYNQLSDCMNRNSMASQKYFATGCKIRLTRSKWDATYPYSVFNADTGVAPEDGFFGQVRGKSYDSRAGALYQAA